MDVRLNHVVAVARSGSFTAAAQMIGVTQSTVTKGVADLERQLGYALFHRTGRGALPTERGRHFAERAARLLDDARELLKGDAADGDPFAGTLRIGVCPASLEWRLIKPLVALMARHPSIRFEISGSNFERMVQLLRNGGVDVVLGFDAAFSEWPDLQRKPASELRTALFVRKGHPALKRRRQTRKLVADYDLVSPSDSRPYGAALRAIYEDQGVDWRKRMHIIDFFPIVRNIVANSDAIGVIALSETKTPDFQKRFAVLNIPDMFEQEPMCCATRARWAPSPAVRAFIRAVQAHS